jgi:formiminotetrahydrofolate cyclodeaminase
MGSPALFEDLLKDISSKSPAPGGGSVAAISGCFAASLISMVCNLTIGKKKYKDVEEEFKLILGEAEELRGELLKLSGEDVEAFSQVMTAYKLPNGEEKEKSLEKAFQKAASVPHKTAVNCLRLLELTRVTTRSGNQNTKTDSAVGALMAYSGIKGAIYNVQVNLQYIKDRNFKAKLGGEIEALEKKAQEILDEILKIMESEPAE